MFLFSKLDQLKMNFLFLRVNYNSSCFTFVSGIPTEEFNPEMKKTKDEIISVTDDTEKEFIDIDEDLLEVETFDQEEMEIHLPDHEGQFIRVIFLFGFINLKLVNDYLR